MALTTLPSRIVAVFVVLMAVASAQPRKHDCEKECVAGQCHFEDCAVTAHCPGGLCEFTNCLAPSCEGGACTFNNCEHPSCSGGGCHFHNPQTTLEDGYCQGGSCFVNGKRWESKISDRLSY
mmetsp:Transcript_18592/g.43305  ORF Transcript_18592/g.43305 Transcript_18592/m.43305 type:complete len:122 (+) Transcript_18592:74-439(+)